MTNLSVTSKEPYISNFQAKIRTLRAHHVYTYVAFDSNGHPYSEKANVLHIRYITDENGLEAYVLVCKDHGKYKKSISLNEGKQFLLYDEVVRPDTSFKVWEGIADWDESGHCLEQKKWPAYDTRYLLRAMASVAMRPFIYNYKEKLEPEVLLTCAVIS